MSNIELVSKISTKTVIGKVDIKKLHEKGEVQNLMRVIGLASGLKTGESNFGPFTAFTGNFKAINLESGKEFRSGKIFLPQIAEALVEGALSQADSDAVEFAFDIGVKPVQDRQGKDSYEYTVSPLIAAQDNDPLNALEGKILAALPAPTETKPETETGKGKK